MLIHKYLLESGIINNAFEAYGFKDIKIKNSESGYRNHSFPAITTNGDNINLIIYKFEPHIIKKIKTANSVSTYLQKQGLPVRHSIDPRILKIKTASNERYAGLYNYLPGETIPWEAYTRKHLKLVGAMMAKMHDSLKSMPIAHAPNVAQEYINILNRLEGYFAGDTVNKAIDTKLGVKLKPEIIRHYLQILKVCQNLPDKQMLHMDFVRGNILFNSTAGEISISGILDFEKAGYGHVLLDIARTLAFLFVDCKYKDPAEIHQKFLISGYVRSSDEAFSDIVINKAKQKVSILNELTKMFMLHDFYKFLRHNPYEFLSENEHYVRTRDYLIQGKVLERLR
jgi:Ser/Thr protein kinase RdoA (MazF antagonist)